MFQAQFKNGLVLKTPQDISKLVQLSAQEGLIKNFAEIVSSNKYKEIRDGLKMMMGEETKITVQDTIKRLKI